MDDVNRLPRVGKTSLLKHIAADRVRGFWIRMSRPASRRLRWPIGRRSESVLGWVVTESKVKLGELVEARAEALSMTPEARRIRQDIIDMGRHYMSMHDSPGGVEYRFANPRQGWSPTGEVIA